MAQAAITSQQRERRLFLGVPLALRFEGAFAGILANLKRRTKGVRWVEAGQVHATLHFFGNVSEDLLPQIRECALGVCAAAAPLKLGTGAVGFFPDAENPRILWLEVTGDTEALVKLQKALAQALEVRGFPVEHRPFRPHATLGRIKDSSQFCLRGTDSIESIQHELFEGIALYQSVLLPQGSRYEILEKYPLGGAF